MKSEANAIFNDNFNPAEMAGKYYDQIVQKPLESLMAFLSTDVAVTYFDEAHNLEVSFWILLRLLRNQPPSTSMWHVFMGTKSQLSYHAPRPADSRFLLSLS